MATDQYYYSGRRAARANSMLAYRSIVEFQSRARLLNGLEKVLSQRRAIQPQKSASHWAE